MNCPRCNQETKIFIDTPPGSEWRKACKACSRFAWREYDQKAGLDKPATISEISANRVHRRKPTERHKSIAGIARSLGVNVTDQEVQIIMEATRIEYEDRTGKNAAGGIGRRAGGE